MLIRKNATSPLKEGPVNKFFNFFLKEIPHINESSLQGKTKIEMQFLEVHFQ